nr:cupin domain-containing protein [Flavilitoribacter sp.]
AQHNWQRFNWGFYAEKTFVANGYRQDHLVRQNRYQEQTTSQVLNLWIGMNEQIVTVLEAMPEEQWKVRVTADWLETPWTLDQLATDYVDHLEHHLKQIFRPEIQDLIIDSRWHVSVEEAAGQLRTESGGKPFVKVLENRTMTAELFAPKGKDTQSPHEQDELYMVISGTGQFIRGDERIACRPGDLLFVPARMPHRFEDFSADFRVWVVFY